MNTLDLVILIFLLIGAYRGFKKGLFIEIVGIAAFILAIIGSFKLLHVGIDFLASQFGSFSHLFPYIAFVLLFIGILLLINLLGKAVKKMMDLTLLGSMDNFAGAIVGILKWGIAISIFLWLTDTVGFKIPETSQQGSMLYGYIAPLGPKTIEIISSIIPFMGDLIDSIRDLIKPPAT